MGAGAQGMGVLKRLTDASFQAGRIRIGRIDAARPPVELPPA